MKDSKIEWCDHSIKKPENKAIGETLRTEWGLMDSGPERVGSTSPGLTKRNPVQEGHVMAVSTLSFRAYIGTLSGRKLGAFKTAAAKAGISFEEYISRVERGMKRCIDCGEWQDRSQFAVDASRWDGLGAKCKACSNIRGVESHEPIPIKAQARCGIPRDLFRSGDKEQARHLVNLDVAGGRRPNPNDLHCALCGHKGDDKRHEYHHHMGYAAEHFYDVIPLCTICHHAEH